MRRSKAAICFGSLASVLTVAACTDLSDPTVVSIGGDALTVSELRQAYADIPVAKRPLLDSPTNRRLFVDLFVERRLLASHGENLLLSDTTGVAGAIAANEEQLMRDRLRVLIEGEPVATDEEVAQAHDKLATRVRVERFYFPTLEMSERAYLHVAQEPDSSPWPENAAPTDSEQVWITWGLISNPEADAVVEGALNEFTRPLRAGARYHLSRILERESRVIEPLDSLRTAIARSLLLRRKAEILEESTRGFAEARQVAWLDEHIALVAKRTREAISSARTHDRDPHFAIPEFSEAEFGLELATWLGGGRWTIREYVAAIRRQIAGQRPSRGPLHLEVMAACRREVGKLVLAEEARKRGLASDWWVQKNHERFRQDRLALLASETLGAKAKADPARFDSLASALNLDRHLPQLTQSRKIRFLQFDLPTEEAAWAELRAIDRAGGPLARLDVILQGDPSFAGVYHLSELTPSAAVPEELRRAVFDEAEGSLVGPLRLANDWVIVCPLHSEDATPITSRQILDQYRTQLQLEASRTAVGDWIRSERERLGIVIDASALDALSPGA